MSDGAFVFAVCGPREHLERAAAAAARLRRFTRRRVVLLTDPSRNEIRPTHDDVVEMATPPELDSARAAIFLKTSVAEALDLPGPHAYLDSDVVAVSPEVDRIFERFEPPVTFASDLPTPGSSLRTFSSHAVDCPCAVERDRLVSYFERLDSLTELHRRHGQLREIAEEAFYRGARFEGERRSGKWWNGRAEGGRTDGAIRFTQTFREGQPAGLAYSFRDSDWRLLQDASGASRWLDSRGTEMRWVGDGGGYWEDASGDSLRTVASAHGEERWWYRSGTPARRWLAEPSHEAGGRWVDSAGAELGVCDHLRERLEALFDIVVADPAWVPWNGGVFLFDAGSRSLLADWRSRCLRIFATPGFRARDQGALVATAWALGLEHHPRLPERFNRLVDRRSPAARGLRLDALLAEGACLLHLIGGGLDDATWPLSRDLAGSDRG